MIKRFFISLIIGLVSLAAVIFLQVYLANQSVDRERQILIEVDALLFETRTLLSNIDQFINPLEKSSYVSLANSKLGDYQLPPSGQVMINPLNLDSVRQANARRLALQSAREQIPSFLASTSELLNQLEPAYAGLKSYLEYEPTDDLFERSIEQNEEEFMDRLVRARTGVKRTLEKVGGTSFSNPVNKQKIIESVSQSQSILLELITATEEREVDESDRLRQKFISTVNDSRLEIDQIITTDIGSRKELIEESERLSEQIQAALKIDE